MYSKAKRVMTLIILTTVVSVFLLNTSFYAALEDANPRQSSKGTPKPPASQSEPKLSSESAILVDLDRMQILYERQMNKKLHISTASKIMTTIVAIENVASDAQVTISKDSANPEGSSIILDAGDKHSAEDLLYAIMLASANDAAKAIAEHVGGDVQKFVDLMNKKASELNMKNTRFLNPTGLSEEGQYTTAYDISLLMKYALDNSTFYNLFSTRAKPWNDSEETKLLVNPNKLLWSYDGVEGGKTGFNTVDQKTAITSARRNGMRLLAIVLNTPDDKIFSDTALLLDYGFNNFRKSILISKDKPVKSISVDDKSINLVSHDDVSYTHPLGESYISSIEYKMNQEIKPPINKSLVLGTVKYTLADQTVIEVALYPDTEMLPPSKPSATLLDKLLENRDLFYLIAFLLLIECFLILYHLVRFFKKITTGRR